jgi:TPR repeat protein
LALTDNFGEAKKAYAAGDYEKVAKFYKKVCDKGYAQSYHNLRYMYYNGKGVEEDNTKTLKLLEKACVKEVLTVVFLWGLCTRVREILAWKQIKLSSLNFLKKTVIVKNAENCFRLGYA